MSLRDHAVAPPTRYLSASVIFPTVLLLDHADHDPLIAKSFGRRQSLQANTSGGGARNRVTIGAPLEELRQHLMRYGDVLTELVEAIGAIARRQRRLHLKQMSLPYRRRRARSGRARALSSTLRAAARFLPTSVTPWTTAVTNLHFGQPAPASYGNLHVPARRRMA